MTKLKSALAGIAIVAMAASPVLAQSSQSAPIQQSAVDRASADVSQTNEARRGGGIILGLLAAAAIIGGIIIAAGNKDDTPASP